MTTETTTSESKGRWSEEEHERYLAAMVPFLTWDHVAKCVGTRSRIQCRTHHQKIQKRVEKEKKSGNVRSAPRVEHRLPTTTNEKISGVQASLAITVKQALSPPATLPFSPNDVTDASTNAFNAFAASAEASAEGLDFQGLNFEDLDSVSPSTDMDFVDSFDFAGPTPNSV